MVKGQHGRHKGDIAIDNLMRDAKIARIKEKLDIKNNDAVAQCMNKKEIKHKPR
jgi:hypothetical protein